MKYFPFIIALSLSSLFASVSAYAQDATTYAFGDWRVTCTSVEGDTASTRCIMNQRGLDSKTKRDIYQVGFSVVKGVETPKMDVLVPLGVTLAQGLVVEVVDGLAVTIPYQRCVNNGCLATAIVDDKFMESLKAGAQGRIHIVDVTGKTALLPFSLNGFSGALKKLALSK